MKNQVIIFFSFSQLMEDIQIGALGHSAVQHVTMELNSVFAHAQIHRLQTVENNARDLIKKHGYARILIRAEVDHTFIILIFFFTVMYWQPFSSCRRH